MTLRCGLRKSFGIFLNVINPFSKLFIFVILLICPYLTIPAMSFCRSLLRTAGGRWRRQSADGAASDLALDWIRDWLRWRPWWVWTCHRQAVSGKSCRSSYSTTCCCVCWWTGYSLSTCSSYASVKTSSSSFVCVYLRSHSSCCSHCFRTHPARPHSNTLYHYYYPFFLLH